MARKKTTKKKKVFLKIQKIESAEKKTSSKKKADREGVLIKVVGVGGAGGNAISRMIDYFPRGIDLIAINTDAQDLSHCQAKKKLCIGKQITKGRGAGMNPELGKQAAEENRDDIAAHLSGADLIFITSGFGGGTGSGAAAVVAEIAQEMGITTIAVVTKPFSFEGGQRAQIAQDALARIKDRVDALITISNDRIFSVINKDTSLAKAFEAIDEVLKNAVLGITELLLSPGIINVDFADIKGIIQSSGSSIIGVGIGSGKDRALHAAQSALNSPLLETSIDGSKGVLFSVSGLKDIKMHEINDVAKIIAEQADPNAKIIFGTYYDRKLSKGQIKVTVIATGFGSSYGRTTSLFSDFETFKGTGQSLSSLSTSVLFDTEKKEGYTTPPTQRKEGGEKETSDENEKNEETQDEWDIPAFLRKRGRRGGK